MYKRLPFIFTIIISVFSISILNSQVYEDYVGGGHSEGIDVISSSNYQAPGWSEIASGDKTLNGDGLDARKMETARFLSQATLGASPELIEEVSNMDYEEWIDNQIAIPASSLLAANDSAFNLALQIFISNGGNAEDYFGPYFPHFFYGWWQTNLTNEDLLRQRVAYALSQILVISARSSLQDYGDGLGSYYDVLVDNAFGNYKDLLMDVTYHPMMGRYLSHFNNPLAIPDLNIHPDENYAREIMQLFSIGLYELNIDGSIVLDGDDNPIPTYDNDDIKELAKVFTGLGPGDVMPNPWVNDPIFGLDFYITDKTTPMLMYEEWHETDQKILIDGTIIPPFQDGDEDIEMAVDVLFNHPNVGPFIARRLIQHMVKSNPSPQYIQAVAETFNNNGSGIRGDMKAVIKAILLHDEARTCEWINEPFQGKLREPLLRYVQFSRAIDKDAPDDLFWNIGDFFAENTGQGPLFAPSVFNWFLPDFQPNGEIEQAGLVAPEFQIHNSKTSIGFANNVYAWTSGWGLLWTWEGIDPVQVDVENLKQLARDSEVLINELDIMFTNGQLTAETREIIKNAVDAIIPLQFGALYLDYRTSMAVYLIMISPDYAILK